MQQRWQAGAIVAVALACLAGCESGPKPAAQRRLAGQSAAPAPRSPAEQGGASAPRHPAEQSGAPLLVPQSITLRGPAQLSAVSGACYIVRGEGGVIAQQGAILQNGDVLDLGNADEHGSVTIHSGAQSEVVLRRESGRFFKLQIAP